MSTELTCLYTLSFTTSFFKVTYPRFNVERKCLEGRCLYSRSTVWYFKRISVSGRYESRLTFDWRSACSPSWFTVSPKCLAPITDQLSINVPARRLVPSVLPLAYALPGMLSLPGARCRFRCTCTYTCLCIQL